MGRPKGISRDATNCRWSTWRETHMHRGNREQKHNPPVDFDWGCPLLVGLHFGRGTTHYYSLTSEWICRQKIQTFIFATNMLVPKKYECQEFLESEIHRNGCTYPRGPRPHYFRSSGVKGLHIWAPRVTSNVNSCDHRPGGASPRIDGLHRCPLLIRKSGHKGAALLVESFSLWSTGKVP